MCLGLILMVLQIPKSLDIHGFSSSGSDFFGSRTKKFNARGWSISTIHFTTLLNYNPSQFILCFLISLYLLFALFQYKFPKNASQCTSKANSQHHSDSKMGVNEKSIIDHSNMATRHISIVEPCQDSFHPLITVIIENERQKMTQTIRNAISESSYVTQHVFNEPMLANIF